MNPATPPMLAPRGPVRLLFRCNPWGQRPALHKLLVEPDGSILVWYPGAGYSRGHELSDQAQMRILTVARNIEALAQP